MSAVTYRPFNAYIVDAVRTAAGKKNGRLSKMHPADLGAVTVNALLDRNKIDGKVIDDVILGCVSQVGAQGANLARNVVLSSKLPETVPGTTVDRQCGSSLQAMHFAAQCVMSGTQDVVIAGGVEVMSLVPIGSSVMAGMANNNGHPFVSKGIDAKYQRDGNFSQFDGAEMLAKKFDIPKSAMDKLAFESHKKAANAMKNGYFKNEIIPVQIAGEDGKVVVHDKDEGVRPESTLEKISALKPLNPEGRISAAASSQISDGSAMVLICNERGLQKLGLKPRARFVSLALAGDDPVVMLGGPIPATFNALKQAKLDMKQIDLYEVNEAFASVPLAWAQATKADLNKLNVNGGAMALGHPLGATGAKLMATLVNELERRQVRYGLMAICEGGGTANAAIIERVNDVVPAETITLKSKL